MHLSLDLLFPGKKCKAGIWDDEKNFKTAKCMKILVLLFLIISLLNFLNNHAPFKCDHKPFHPKLENLLVSLSFRKKQTHWKMEQHLIHPTTEAQVSIVKLQEQILMKHKHMGLTLSNHVFSASSSKSTYFRGINRK